MFPNAAKGIKKIHTAEILSLITAILGIGLAIAVIVAAASLSTMTESDSSSAAGLVGGGLASILLAVAVAVISIIAFILKLVGIMNAKKDEAAFNSAFILVLVGIGASLVAAIFSKNTLVNGIMNGVSNVASLFITVYIIKGIINIGGKLGNKGLVQKGQSVLKLIVAVYAISIVGSLISSIFENVPALATVGGVLGVIAGVVAIVYYFIYLSLLGKAKKEIA